MASQTIFVLLCQIILNTPSPSFFSDQEHYSHLLGLSLVRIHFSGCFSYLIAILINTKILTHWKVLLHGKRFWLRSLGTCSISELLYSLTAIMLMELQSIPFQNIIKVVALSYLIKMSYNLLFIYPAQLVVNKIRNKAGVDVYDFNRQFTPSFYKNYGAFYD